MVDQLVTNLQTEKSKSLTEIWEVRNINEKTRS